ncbi:MAG: hypothetical protein DCF22_00495 [Leptolyngbya sp.]|nr:MAG: hypothetical protein DCF22_00495 [Leptolyngbya sp.]
MLEPYSVPFIDCLGKVRRIRSLPLSDRAWFLTLRTAAIQLIADQDFRALYDSPDSHFRTLVDECLLLSKISPAWVDTYSATRLLFGMGDEPAILIALNFPEEPEEKGAKPLPSTINPQAYSIAALWSESDGLEQAIAVANHHPWLEVRDILKAKAYQNKQGTDDEDEETRIEESREGLERLIQTGKMQEFLDARRNAIDPDEFAADDFEP